MFNSNVLWILAAFVVYMGVMIAIGAKYMKSTKNSEDYFLGGRGLSGWVAALSAQASDMSGWLLMGLPGAVYAFGTGQAWIAIGLFIGTVCNWIFISGRLRRYTKKNIIRWSVEMQSTDEKYMKEAIKQAKKAYAIGEVPIGCVIVYQDKIIGRGYNRRTIDNNTLAHAELAAIRKASRKMNDWRLEDCTMYVTLEPCQMCSGAIVQSRMTRVVVGCMNPKAGCAGSILNLLDMPEFNHQVELTTGVMEEECSQMMKSFFKELREARKKKKQLEKEQTEEI